MDECYCALCGVCFGIFTDLYQQRVSEDEVAWTEFFRLLRQRPQSEDTDNDVTIAASSYALSGVGWGLSPGNARAPPPSYDARTLHREQLIEQVNDDHDRVVPYRSRDGEYEVVFPFHAACWDLFEQEHALLAKGKAGNPELDILGRILASQRLEDEGRGLHPDWAVDYDGPETFWSDGWADHPEPEASNVAGILDSYSELDYLVIDPVKLGEQAQNLCNEPPLLPSIQSRQPVKIRMDDCGNDYFYQFPVEILNHIISFLPTQSVRAVRLASRAIAWIELDSTFWHSRFVFPNELSHIFIPSTKEITRRDKSTVDWRLLYKKLYSVTQDDKHQKNRRRIRSLNQQLLLKSWPHMDSFKPLERNSASVNSVCLCRQRLKIPGAQTSSHQSILFHEISSLDAIHRISAYFSSPNRRPVLRGLALHGSYGIKELGRYKEQMAESVNCERGMLLKCLVAGMTPEGIVGLKLQGIDANDPRVEKELILGVFDGEVPLGQLKTDSNDIVKGLKVEITQDGRITGLGLLERDNYSTISSHELQQGTPPNPLWYPTIPPVTWKSTIRPSHDADFTYLHHTTFASDFESLKHLTHVCVFVDMNPPGIYGLQFHYDDRVPIPAVSPFIGKGVSFMINGTLDESVCAALTSYSERSQSASLTIFTNQGRQACFSTSDTPNDRSSETHLIDDHTYAAGIVARVVVSQDNSFTQRVLINIIPQLKGDRSLPYQDFGLLCAPRVHRESPKISDISSDRIYDDNHNVWIESKKPPLDCLFGETVGSQPRYGFVDWIAFDQPISRITACLLTGKRNFRGEEVPPSLTGVKFDTDLGLPKLLGRCSSFGPCIELEVTDRIVGISIGLQLSERSRFIQEIIFISKFGTHKGFRAGKLIEHHECQSRHILESSINYGLVGLVWSFDLGPAYIGDQGVQALYRFYETQPEEEFVPILYPSTKWNKPPPPNLQLRPIPYQKMHSHELESSLGLDDSHEEFTDQNLTLIKVYFNAFLQGIKFYYSNGASRVLGNTVGIEESLELHNERILTVYITSYVQKLPTMALPRDTMAIAAIRFHLAEDTNSKPKIRFTRRIGSPGIFGPFTNQQRGLWNGEGGGSANWRSCFPSEESCIRIESNTSFVGLWAEVMDTHIQRLGVLVSFTNPLGDIPVSQPADPDTKSQTSSQEEEQTPSPWLAKPPPATLGRGTLFGHELQPRDYLTWNYAPSQPSKIIIYRHAAPHGIVVVGIELFARSALIAAASENTSTLLGFRSLWMEHAITLYPREDDQKIAGIGVKPHQPSQWRSSEQGLGLESVRIWTTQGLLAADGDDDDNGHAEGWLDATCGDGEKVAGFAVALGEFVQAVGLVTSRE